MRGDGIEREPTYFEVESMLKWRAMKCALLALPLLFLTGCSRSVTTYESRLELAPLPTPEAKLALPLEFESTTRSYLDALETDIKTAKTPALALASISKLAFQTQIQSSIGLAGSTDNSTKWMTRATEFYERAAKIKAKQLEQGDENDSTGEVARYVVYGRQCYINSMNTINADVGKRLAGLGSGGTPTPVEVKVRVVGPFVSTRKLVMQNPIFEDRVAKQAKKYVIVPIEVTYVGQGDRPLGNNQFQLRANKRIYPSASLLNSPKNVRIFDAHLENGGKATGNVVFEVDMDVKTGVVEYRGY